MICLIYTPVKVPVPMHIVSKPKGRYCQAQAGLVRLEFQKEASYFINTTIDIFESLDNNVIWVRKITIIFDGKHRGEVGVHALSNTEIVCHNSIVDFE